jgi:hypothetical protein
MDAGEGRCRSVAAASGPLGFEDAAAASPVDSAADALRATVDARVGLGASRNDVSAGDEAGVLAMPHYQYTPPPGLECIDGTFSHMGETVGESVPFMHSQKELRQAVLLVSFEVLHDMLLLPESTEILAVNVPDNMGGQLKRCIELFVEDERFEPRQPYQEARRREAVYETEYIARPRFKGYV